MFVSKSTYFWKAINILSLTVYVLPIISVIYALTMNTISEKRTAHSNKDSIKQNVRVFRMF